MLDTTDEPTGLADLAEAAANGRDLRFEDHRDIARAYLEAADEIEWLRRRLDEVKRQAEIDVAFARQVATISKLESDLNDNDDCAWFAELRECMPVPQWLQTLRTAGVL